MAPVFLIGFDEITQEVQVNQNWTLTIYDIEMIAVIRGHPVWAPLMSGQR